MHVSLRLTCLVLPCLLCLAGPVAAQGSNESDLVRSFYRRYLNREPARWEMTSWVRALQRGDSPTRLQGLFMASDEFFRLQGNNPEAWLVAVYQEFVGRAPARGEVRDLLGRFGAVTREQRERLVAAVQSGPAVQPPPPVPRPPTQAPELAARLVSATQQFIDMVRLDLEGSRQGRQLLIRGNNLLAVSERFRQTFAASVTPGQRQQAFADVEQAFQAVQAELANPPGTTPNAAPVAQEIAQLLAALRSIGGVPPPPRPVVPDGLAPGQRDQALRLTADLTLENQRLREYARQVRPRAPAFCDSLLRHAEALAGHLSEFNVRLTRGASLGNLQRAFQPIRNQVRAMQELVRAGCPFVTVEQRVWSLQGHLRRLAEVLMLGPDLGIDPDRPVIIDPPSFPNVPLPPPPPPPPPAVNQKVVIACDRALSLLDAALIQLGPAAAESASIARMLVHTRQLRGDVASLRQRAALGAGVAPLRGGFAAAEQTYLRIRSTLAWALRDNPGFNPYPIPQVGELIEQLRSTIP